MAEFPLETVAAGLRLRMEVRGVELRFAYAVGVNGEWQPVARVFDATACGDWVSPHSNFTGTFWGLCCQDLATRDAWAGFSGFEYQAL